MTDDLGGNYHPPHAILNISYPVETDRPQFSKSKKHNILTQKEKASSANLKPFQKLIFYINFNLFDIFFLEIFYLKFFNENRLSIIEIP